MLESAVGKSNPIPFVASNDSVIPELHLLKTPSGQTQQLVTSLSSIGVSLFDIPSLQLSFTKESALRKTVVNCFLSKPKNGGSTASTSSLEWIGLGPMSTPSLEFMLYRQSTQSNNAPIEVMMKSWTASGMISAIVLQDLIYILHENSSISHLNLNSLELESVYTPPDPSVKLVYSRYDNQRTRLLFVTKTTETASLEVRVFHVLNKQIHKMAINHDFPSVEFISQRIAVDSSLSTLCLADDKGISVFDITSGAPIQKRIIHLLDKPVYIYLPHPNWILVQSTSQSKAKVNTISLWDVKFGTLQSKIDQAPENGRILQAVHAETEEYGHVFLACQTSSSATGISTPPTTPKKKKKSKVLNDESVNGESTVSIQMYPFHLPELGLSDVIGKRPTESFLTSLQSKPALEEPVPAVLTPFSFSSPEDLKEWVSKGIDMEKVDIQKLTKLAQIVSEKSSENAVPEFTAVFCEWILSKQDSISKDAYPKFTSKTDYDSLLLSETLPCVALSQPSILAFCAILRMKSVSTAFWPRATIEYLLANHSLSEHVCTDALIRIVLEKRDWSLLMLCLEELTDLGISSLKRIISALCDPKNVDSFQRFAKQYSSHIESRFDLSPQTHGPFVKQIQQGVSPIQSFLLYTYFGRCFVGERDITLNRVLKSCSTEQVLVILEWTLLSLIPPAVPSDSSEDDNNEMDLDTDQPQPKNQIRHYLWWLFSEDGQKAHFETRFDQWVLSLDVFMALLDTHGSSLQFMEEIQPLLFETKTLIHRSLSLFETYDMSLRGPLSLLYNHTSKPGSGGRGRGSSFVNSGVDGSDTIVVSATGPIQEIKKSHGKRWRGMLKQVQDGVGEYALEVLDL